MFSITPVAYGFKIEFSGFIKAPEMKEWLEKSIVALQKAPQNFKVFVDLSEMKALPEDAAAILAEGQGRFRKAGMQRSAVITKYAIQAMQMERLAKESGISATERYISKENPKWHELAMGWITLGRDPNEGGK